MDGLGRAIDQFVILAFLAFPLALWKVIDILIWIVENVRIELVL